MTVDHRQLIARKSLPRRLQILALGFKARLLGRHPVAILLTERLGDLLACEPVAREVKRARPRAFVVWFCDGRFADVVRAFPGVDAVVPVICLTEIIEIEPLLDGWDVIDLHLDGKECGECRLPRSRTGGDSSIKTENYYLYGTLQESHTRAAAFTVLDRTPLLPLSADIRRAVDRLRLPESFVVLHCESDEAARNWKDPLWLRLALELQREYALSIVEVGGAPAGCLPENKGILSLCGKLSLLETAEVIRRARLFVGIDSGPAHLANAVRTPGVILIGRYRIFRHYLPYNGFYGAEGGGAIVIQHWEEAEFIPYRKVSTAVRSALRDSEPQRQDLARRLRELPPADVFSSPEADAPQSRPAPVFQPVRISDETGQIPPALTSDQESGYALVLDLNRSADTAIFQAVDRILAGKKPFFLVITASAVRQESGDRFAWLNRCLSSDGYVTVGEHSLIALDWGPTNDSGRRFMALADQAADDCGTSRPRFIAIDLSAGVSGPAKGYALYLTAGVPTTGPAEVLGWPHFPTGPISLVPSKPLHLDQPLLPALARGREVASAAQPAFGRIEIQIRQKDGSLLVSGWGILTEAWPRPADALLLGVQKSDGRLLIQRSIASSHHARPDVVQLRQDPDVSFSGWHWLIPAELLAETGPKQLALYDAWLDRVYLLGTLQTGAV